MNKFVCDKLVNDELLKVLVDAKSCGLSKERKEYLNNELNNVIAANRSNEIIAIYMIINYLKEHNDFYYLAGNITSSYLAYVLGIHSVDCFSYNINPLFCYGEDYKKELFINLRVNKYNKDRIINDLKDNILKDYFFNVVDSDGESFKEVFAVLFDEGMKDKKVRYMDMHNYKEKALHVNIICHDEVTILDMMLNKTKNNDVNKLLNKIKTNKQIIDKLCKYYDYLNIEKSYLPLFNTDEINEIVKDYKPNSLDDLIKITGMIFDNSVWKYNQKELFKFGFIKKGDIISTRDDVYDLLLNNGLDEKISFDIAEKVRKGTFSRCGDKDLLRSKHISDKTIDILKRITYLPSRSCAILLLHNALLMEYFNEEYKDMLYDTIKNVYELDDKSNEKELLDKIYNLINKKLSIDEDNEEKIDDINNLLKCEKLALFIRNC